MKRENFGQYLKSRRVEKGLSLSDLSRATKIKERALEALEAGRHDDLPGRVFVRGYVIAYARAVGLDECEMLGRLQALAPPPSEEPLRLQKPIVRRVTRADDEDLPNPRRKVGVVMVVLLILVVATLTLSLLLRHGGTGSGIS